MHKSDAEYRAVSRQHGLPDLPQGEVIDMRWQAGRDDWWAHVKDHGWFWLDSRSRIWKWSNGGP